MYLESRHNSLLISHALRPLIGLIIVKHSFHFHEHKAHTHQETKGSFEDESWDHPSPPKITSWKFSKYWNYCVPFRELSVDLTLGIGYQRQTSLKPRREERTLRKRWNKHTAHICPFTRACQRPFANYLHTSCLIWVPQPFCEMLTNSILILKVSKLRFSSTLPWKIPWTKEPGRLQSLGSRRVGHDWAASLSLFTFVHWRRKWQPTPLFLPGESQGQRSLVGCGLWGRTESDTTEAT